MRSETVAVVGDEARLDEIRERRHQLFGLLLLVFVLAAGGVALFSYSSEILGDRPLEVLDIDVLRLSFVVLCLAFGLYVWEKERTLARVERALLEERIRAEALSRRLSEMTAISRAGRAVASVLSADDALDLILQSAQELLGATEGSVMLLDRERNVLRMAASVGLNGDVTKEIPVGESVSGWVAEFREPVIVGPDPHPRFRRFIQKARDLRSAMSAPLYARGEPVGVLNVSVSAGTREYTEHDLQTFTVLAEYAAIAIANARLFERQRETASRLERLDAERREFLAIVTHDLRAPLTAVLGYAHLLREIGPMAPPEQREEFAEIIERQGRRMLDMVEQLIMVASLEEGGSVLADEPLDIPAVVHDVVGAFSGAAGRRTIVADVPAIVSAVHGDATAVRHIVANLVDNAIKYSPEDAPVDVVVEEAEGEVRIGVLDRGPGIPPEVLPQLFDRYSRGDGESGGFGLGLFIVRSLVEGQGGRVWVRGRNGGGTSITVALPVQRRDASDEPAAKGR